MQSETLFHKELFLPNSNNIFVFGSNTAGRHGKGAAKFAKEFCGAVMGQGLGLFGNSYAIPTKGQDEHGRLHTLPLDVIRQYVDQFAYFAEQNKDKLFYITRIGCGLAGYQDIQIAPMFNGCSSNCVLPSNWQIQDMPIILLDSSSA